MISRVRTILALLIALLSIAVGRAAVLAPPKLVVILVVDQMRGDYVDKFQDRWTGGLHRLIASGAWFRQTDYPYFTTVTCAGHATISTGSLPFVHGMIGNSWWDRGARKEVACADDDGTSIVSYGRPLKGAGESGRALRTTTLADELRVQLDPAARVVGLSLKARSVVTLVGQRADAAVWFDDRGEWVTSTAFAATPSAAVSRFVQAHPITDDFGSVWDRLLPLDQYWFPSPAVGASPKSGMTPAFPHPIGQEGGEPDAAFYSQWQSSPNSDAYLAKMALALTGDLQLGQRRTDFLGISFSALDRVGHDFGPESHEVQDVLARLDRTLGLLFDGLDRLVGPDRYVVALTADHGVAPVPESVLVRGVGAERLSPNAIQAAAEDALRMLGPGSHVARVLYNDVYLKPGVWPVLERRPALRTRVRAALGRLPGVGAVYFRDQLAGRAFQDDDLGAHVARSFDEERSGDIFVALDPYWLEQASGTSHGTAYGYDTRVPLFLMGRGIAAGEYLQRASPADIAPTLALLAGVTLPHAQGRVLGEAFSR